MLPLKTGHHTTNILLKIGHFLLYRNTTTTDKFIHRSHNSCLWRLLKYLENGQAYIENNNTNKYNRNKSATVLMFKDVQLEMSMVDQRNGLNDVG